MKKIISICLAILIFFVGCSDTKYQNKDNIGDYKFAEYEKYSHETKGPILDGDKIYINGTISDMFSSGPATSIIVTQEDKKQWIVGISYNNDVDREKISKDWINAEIIACGSYIGWSDSKQCPAIIVEKIIYKEKEYKIEDFLINFADGETSSDVE